MKKGDIEVGIGIIILAFLFLLSGIFVDNSGTNNSNLKSNYNNTNNSMILFHLTNTIIGKQNKISEGFPNIEVGSPYETNVVYQTSSFALTANFLMHNIYQILLPLRKNYEIDHYLVYAKLNKSNGDDNVIVKINGLEGYKGNFKSTDIPIILTPVNSTTITQNNKTKIVNKITFEINKPKFYQIWKWDDYTIKNLKIAEVAKKTNQKEKTFQFYVNKKNLERVTLGLTVDCADSETNNGLSIYVNNYSLYTISFNCQGRYSSKTLEIPLNILKNNNILTFKTNGYYKISYLINKIYYNNVSTYYFNINNFNSIVDVIMYGNFDQETLDLKINNKLVTLHRGETISILKYINYGVNRIYILDLPINIKNLYIQGINYYWNNN